MRSLPLVLVLVACGTDPSRRDAASPVPPAPSAPDPAMPEPAVPEPAVPEPAVEPPSPEPAPEPPVGGLSKTVLRKKMEAGTASLNELKQLRALCMMDGDRACKERAETEIAAKK